MESKHRFISYDGTELEGTLMPCQSAGDTLVLMVHGITSSRDEFGLFSGLAANLAQERIPSFRFDYRCHGISTIPMEQMTLTGIVNDIEAAANCSMGLTNKASVFIVGMSFGGGLSAFWAASTLRPVRGIVMFAPVIDYEEDLLGKDGVVDGVITKQPYRMELEAKGFVEVEGVRYGRALLGEMPYINGIEGIKRANCDLLIVHGDSDSVVPFNSSERFAKLNSRCQLVNIAGTDHGFGVDGDEDLTWPETKAKHHEVFQLVSDFINGRE
ncbi:MAG: alpha/beta fold hydrolase [Blastocatellia bacterium]